MNSRLSRPLLAAVVSGAFLAGGGLFTGPAFADPTPTPEVTESTGTSEPTTAPTTVPTTEPTTDPTDPTTEPTTAPTDDPTTAPTSAPPTTTAPPATTAPTSAPPTTTTPPPADKTAPSGTFTPNRWAIWTGQSVTLTLAGIKDNVSTPAQIKRVVTWGDGTSSSVNPAATTVAHTYKSSGKKPITLTLTDAAGNKRVVKSGGPTVSVPALKFKLSRTAVYPGQKFVWEITQVPAGATKLTVAWGDGRASVLPVKKQKVTRYYFVTPNNYLVTPGVKVLKAYVSNKYGAATPLTVGKVLLVKDTSRPVVKLTLPKKPNKASSWKAIRGTATDKGSGIKEMFVIAVVDKSNGSVVCYSSKSKKWLTITANTDINRCLSPVKASKGKFALGFKGSTPKGRLLVDVAAMDWAGLLNKEIMYERTIS